MSDVALNDALLQKIGGWQAVKEARALHAAGKVLSAEWKPPELRGEVQAAGGVLKTGLTVKDAINVENHCTCREARQWGKICGHALAVAVEVLHPTPRTADQNRSTASSTASQASTPDGKASTKATADLLSLSPEGVALKLCLILPTDLAGSIVRGRISVFVEAHTERQRIPLASLDTEESYAINDDTRRLLDRLLEWSDGQLPATLQLDTYRFGQLLEILPEGSASLGRKETLIVSQEPYRIRVEARLKNDGTIRLEARLPEPRPMIVPGETFWVLERNRLAPLALPGGSASLLQQPRVLSRDEVPAFLQNDFAVLAATGDLDADFTPEDFDVRLEPPRIQLQLEGGLARLRAGLKAVYGNDSFDLARSLKNPESPWIVHPEDPKTYRLRDRSAEQQAVAVLIRDGFEGPDEKGHWKLSGQEAVLSFFARTYPRLQREWEVTLEERLDWSLDKNVERIEPRCEIRSSVEQWFDFGVQFETNSGERFSQADIQRLVLGGGSHTKLRNGKFALIDTGAVEELQEMLIDTAPKQEAGRYRFRGEQAPFLQETLQNKLGWQVTAPTAWQNRAQSRAGLHEIRLGDFESVLRPYQQDGVRWMHKLQSGGFGGILADEMGLGKTLQALACIATRPKSNEASKPCLVICPTSLVFNWKAEAEKFAPQLKVLVLQGPKRHDQFEAIPRHDLVITSYALARRDAEAYRSFEFDIVFLDEAQHIKNRESQNAQAVKSIRSKHRLVLTGTPMENSVLDLWSIFDFLMPGYLGSARDFKERYEQPLTKGGDRAIQDRLSRRVRPFILRRLKREVAADLPDKLEQVVYCDLTRDQKAVYQQVLDAGRQEVLNAVGSQGFGKSRMVIFNALLRLRQICCDMRLLKTADSPPQNPSGKVELFEEMLEEIQDGNHRALVFSQFTSMLALLRDHLEANGIDYCYLDGSTKNRGDVVSRFQKGNAPVFLISLKAGGTGLNLTAADTVMHFDPWWNPAVEDQATDRAHRIGQRRVVTSYKLIARDTVEEKILKLQQKKREAIRTVFGDEGTLTDSLSWEEVQELFG